MKDRSAFSECLTRLFDEGAAKGAPSLSVTAADLCRMVCGQAGAPGQMPICCGAMRALMRVNDRVLFEPPKGKGSSLAILYRLPREGGEKP